MKTYSRLTLAFLLLTFFVPQVVGDEPPKGGPHVEYYENGKKKVEGHYKNGKPYDFWAEWHDNGQTKSEAHYKYGKVVTGEAHSFRNANVGWTSLIVSRPAQSPAAKPMARLARPIQTLPTPSNRCDRSFKPYLSR